MDPLRPRRRVLRGREYPGKPQAIWSIVVGCLALFVMTPLFAQAGAPGGFVLFPIAMGIAAIGYGLYYLLAQEPAGERIIDLDVTDPVGDDVEGRLRRLERMRREGLISEDEFTSKRAEILNKL